MTYTMYYNSPLGRLLLAADEEGLIGLWFENRKYFADVLKGEAAYEKPEILKKTEHWLDIYFSGKEPDFIPPIHMIGSDFRKSVWNILLTIPYGTTMTYGEIAGMLGEKKGYTGMSAQAVGGAVGHNPVSLIIPCHRVVGTNGSLTGYAGGIDKKVQLLTMEKVDMGRFFVPKKDAGR